MKTVKDLTDEITITLEKYTRQELKHLIPNNSTIDFKYEIDKTIQKFLDNYEFTYNTNSSIWWDFPLQIRQENGVAYIRLKRSNGNENSVC